MLPADCARVASEQDPGSSWTKQPETDHFTAGSTGKGRGSNEHLMPSPVLLRV